MKIIAELADYIKDEAKGARKYAKMAEKYKIENKELSDMFLALATTELEHLDKLHAWVVRCIAQEKSSGKQIPQDMLYVWEYEHGQMIDEIVETKNLVEVVKKR